MPALSTSSPRFIGWRLFGAACGAVGGVAACSYLYPEIGCSVAFDLTSAMGPFLRTIDPEQSHNIGIWAAKSGLFPREVRPDRPVLATTVWGRSFKNPIGLAAGFDKDAQAVSGLLGLGFGFVEVGSITPLPQPGNPQPRVFRLADHRAIINRYGFNSRGVDAAGQELAAFRATQEGDAALRSGVVGVNLGKNKTTENGTVDYCIGMRKLAQYADYVVVNVSSPNTPGLRALQGRHALQDLLLKVKAARDGQEWEGRPPPLLVKIAPDLSEQDKQDIASVVLTCGVDGLVVSNTTVTRPGSIATHEHGEEVGGLSGPPVFEASTAVLRDLYRLTGGLIPIVACGGVSDGTHAYRKIRAGASLVQLYTALAYEGPALIPNIKQQLADCLEADGFSSVAEAVGADHKPQPAGTA